MNIVSYLLELLQQRKEVGITDLGTFCKKKSPGRYDKESQSFLPPSYSLTFTSELRESEALANLISTDRNISTDSANYYIAQFVEEIQQKLETEHEVELEHLGRLFFTEHAGLSFEPVKNINYGSEFYGLPKLVEATPDEPGDSLVEVEGEVYDEIGEAPATPAPVQTQYTELPVIENIELDEVKDDLKHTLQHHDLTEEEVTPAPEFIREQHDEHPNRFGHTPESEVLSNKINQQTSAKEEAAPKTYLHLEEESPVNETVTEAPAFIKEQHAEHPNRFGHDPITDELPVEEPRSIWPKIIIAFIALLIIGALIYYIKPEWFNHEQPVVTVPAETPVDTSIGKLDTSKIKQDSIAKTDSILKANQIQQKELDSAKKKPAQPKAEPTKTPTLVREPVDSKAAVEDINKISSFDIIVYATKDKAAADKYVATMKKKGYDAHIAAMPGAWKKVSLATFKTEKEAREQKDILQEKLKGKGFYVQQIINTQP